VQLQGGMLERCVLDSMFFRHSCIILQTSECYIVQIVTVMIYKGDIFALADNDCDRVECPEIDCPGDQYIPLGGCCSVCAGEVTIFPSLAIVPI
jgi:hypothetical protein